MAKNLFLASLLVLTAAFAVLAPVHTVSAMTAEEYFRDGNRLFRDDLYWAALLRYRQAADGGMESALLHYNTGVAHYRARQYNRARESLRLAVADPVLQASAHYNLGLNAYAAGNTEEALSWLRLVRDQQRFPKLQAYAVAAIARIRAASGTRDAAQAGVSDSDRKRPFTDLALRARIGFGTDDNIFRSPNQNYIDFSNPARPLVTPEAKSGTYVPLSLSAKYLVNSLPFEGFYGAYRLVGRYYTDNMLKNGNEYLHEVSFGSDYQRTEGSRRREVYSAFKVASHDEVYFDPDDGATRSVDGVSVEDRLNYLRYGPEIALRQSHERLSFGAKFKGQLWNYDETQALPEYDHEYFLLQLYGQYKFTESSLLRITAEGYSRRYGDRPAYDLDGEQRIGNPSIRYDYYSLGLRARQRLGSTAWFGIDLQHTARIDQYVGYNDYTRNSFSFEIHWTPGDRFDLAARGAYRIYDYPNAFAFHEPTLARKTQEAADAKLVGTWRIARHLYLVAEAQYRETVSNDTRIQYERNQYLLGVRWER